MSLIDFKKWCTLLAMEVWDKVLVIKSISQNGGQNRLFHRLSEKYITRDWTGILINSNEIPIVELVHTISRVSPLDAGNTEE